ncbi:trypsin delta-like [Drosophila albomicans]|uniref:trypsin n=1 Tax=Drosophila albomicans TaxID=7291 RepID=A0A6P8WTB2_DROAB|nr:trypsin delta-like [Drosophila albomicans]
MGPTVKAIPLAESVPNVGAAVLVSGWGYMETGESPLHLKSVYVNIVNREECARVNKIESTKAKICAASPWKASCNGDSGGPLTYRGKLVGIVSFGPTPCGYTSHPGVYTDVVELRQWIEVEATKLSSN